MLGFPIANRAFFFVEGNPDQHDRLAAGPIGLGVAPGPFYLIQRVLRVWLILNSRM